MSYTHISSLIVFYAFKEAAFLDCIFFNLSPIYLLGIGFVGIKFENF